MNGVAGFAGQNFVLSLFDRLWHKDISEEEAVGLMEKGIEEVRSRVSLPLGEILAKLSRLFVIQAHCALLPLGGQENRFLHCLVEQNVPAF